MSRIVDASVALKFFLHEPESESAARVVAAHSLLAPDLVLAEVTNGLWKGVKQTRLTPAQAGGAVMRLASMFVRLHPHSYLARRALEIALSLAHPVYDCFYLALAEQEDELFVTADDRLLRKVATTPWAARVQPLAAY